MEFYVYVISPSLMPKPLATFWRLDDATIYARQQATLYETSVHVAVIVTRGELIESVLVKRSTSGNG